MEFTLHKYRPTRGLSFLFYTLILGVFANPLSAQQEYRINESDRLDLCTGFFTDNGGSEGDHIEGDGVPDTITICSNSTASDATHIRLTFSEFALNGTMLFYNGEEALPENLFNSLDDQSNDQFPVVEASAGNASGCLTVVYTAAADSPGWLALISCEKACQPVRAELDSSDPVVMPADTGYIDLCIGEEFTLNGMGIYSENGLIYQQSDQVSTFEWNFDDGESGVGVSTTHSYDEPGGYTVQLRITDQNDCSNLNQINQRIRVSPKPAYLTQDELPEIVCIGEEFSLTGSTQFDPSPNANVFVTTEQQSFSARQQLSDTTFLPDGSGVVYSTTLEFSNFRAGQTISSSSDLEAICMNMEHSYVGDLDIWIQCPDGTIATLVDFNDGINLNGQFLGEANDDGTLTPGVGFDYCFNNSAQFTWNQAVSVLNIGGAESIPAGEYAPVQSLNALIGCPLNGDWTLNVRDNLSIDNGYIFSWGLEFNDDLFPDLETFDVGFASAAWEETSDLSFYSADSIVAAPTAAGTVGYRYTVTDDFGCQTDTTVTVEVLPFTHPDCYSCPPLLTSSTQVINTTPGAMVQTNLASNLNLDTSIMFRAMENDAFGQSLFGNFGSAYRSTISVNSVDPDPITSAEQIQSICVNIEAERVGGIRLFIATPNDQLFELSTGNGGEGSNFTNTCFTSDAVTSIQDAEAPFTGEFLPEGNFSTFIGATANGDWTIIAWSVSTGAPLGEFIDWSIEFRNEIPLTYTWTPDDGNLSCTDCPNPTVTAGMENAEYTLSVSNGFGCEEAGTVRVNTNVVIDLELTATDLLCAGDNNGAATVVASNGTEPYTYAWSNEGDTQSIIGLAGGTYVVTVTDANGISQEGSIVVNEPAALVFTSAEVQDLGCNGDASGAISVNATGGTGAITYSWSNEEEGATIDSLEAGTYALTATDENGCTVFAEYEVTEPATLVLVVSATNIACGSNGSGAIDLTVEGGTPEYTYAWSNAAVTQDLTDIPVGDYTVTVTDANGCSATVSATVTQPSALELSAAIVNVACAGDSSGAIELTVVGGSDPFTYAWSNEADAQDLTEVPAGDYTVTVTDGNGCTETATYTVNEAEALEIELASSNLLCNGENTGSIDVTVAGGTGEYTYLWSDEDMSEDRSDLSAGTYSVTVTDENGCTAEASVELTEPAAIVLSLVTTDVLCNGDNTGSIDLTVTGGTPPLGYLWSNGAETEDLTDIAAGEYTVTVTDANGCVSTFSATVAQPSALELIAVVTNAGCSGDNSGGIDLTVVGGREPYTYEWSNGADTQDLTGVTAGGYAATITDANGCTETATYTVNEAEALEVSVQSSNLLCNGDNLGSIDVTVTGGTGEYTYLWSDEATSEDRADLAAGTYSVTVTDESGCFIEASVEITEPDAIELDFVAINVLCNGDNTGSINLAVTGGTPPVTYTWSNGAETEDISMLIAGTYTVTVTDMSGCESVGSVTITEPTAVSLSTIFTDAQCAGEASGSISLDIEGGVEPYDVIWSNGATSVSLEGIFAGDYSATVTDANGCISETTVITVGEPDALSCSIQVVAESFNGNDGALSATVAGGIAPYTYRWNNGATTTDLIGLTPGTYDLTVTDVNGCTSICSAELDAYAIVGDKVFFDTNRDGIQDSDEAGINGIAVTITGVDSDYTATTVTANGGTYRFFVLAGSYRVSFGRPSGGFDASPQNAGDDDEADSDINVISLQTAAFTVAGLETNLSIDAGFFDPCIPGLVNAGLIGEDQTLCGPGNQPDLLVQLAAPVIGEAEGELNYMWMMTTGSPGLVPINQWSPIPNTNSENYQPGVLYETTYFARCVRLDECTFIESNIVEVFVGNDASVDISGPSTSCALENVTYVAENLGSNASANWEVTGPVNVVSTTGNSITLNWGSFGRFEVTLTVTENGCTASNIFEVFVARNCTQGLGTPIGTGDLGQSSEVMESRVYPNPTTATQARLELLNGYTYGEMVHLQIFDATGRQISDQQIEGGRRTVQLNALSGRATGLYIIRLTQGEASETHRLILR